MIQWEKLKHHPHLWQMISGKMVGLIPCAFTGLKDKNGVEIYEGDIMRTERNTIEVFYGEKNFNVIIYGKKDVIEVTGWLVKNKKGETDVLDASFCNGIIIGNIHENPELLCK